MLNFCHYPQHVSEMSPVKKKIQFQTLQEKEKGGDFLSFLQPTLKKKCKKNLYKII